MRIYAAENVRYAKPYTYIVHGLPRLPKCHEYSSTWFSIRRILGPRKVEEKEEEEDDDEEVEKEKGEEEEEKKEEEDDDDDGEEKVISIQRHPSWLTLLNHPYILFSL